MPLSKTCVTLVPSDFCGRSILGPEILSMISIGHKIPNLTKVRLLFMLLLKGSDSSPLLVVCSANCIDQSNRHFCVTEGISEALTF